MTAPSSSFSSVFGITGGEDGATAPPPPRRAVSHKRACAERRLKDEFVRFVDDIIELCPDDNDLVLARCHLSTLVEPYEIVDSFTEHVVPWRREIKARDEAFFRENENIFGMLPQDKVVHFRTLWIENYFTPDDKNVIWDYWSAFIDHVDAIAAL